MENNCSYTALPKLGFGEAVKKVLNNLTNFKGRSRRSEYWWFVLAMSIVNVVLSLVLSSVPIVNGIVSVVLSLFMIAVCARRVQDSGHSAVWVYVQFICNYIVFAYMLASGYFSMMATVNPDPEKIISVFGNPLCWIPGIVYMICGVVVFVFCLFDSNIGPNKYGDSPKYVAESNEMDA